MAAISKRQKAVQGKLGRAKYYAVSEALALTKELATAKFDESIDVAVSLGIDARKSDQLVRGLGAEITKKAIRPDSLFKCLYL